MKSVSSCPCGSGEIYSDCCAIAHQHLSNVETSEALMRSRYTAFVQSNGDFLMASHHTMTRKTVNKKALVQWARSVKWNKLEIVKTVNGQKDDLEGIVEFKAHFKTGGKRSVLHQEAKFVREFGHWVYFDVQN